MNALKIAMLTTLICSPFAGWAANCDVLNDAFHKYDNAMVNIERRSRAEVRASAADTLEKNLPDVVNIATANTLQTAVTNILLRQQLIVEMMIALDCELPEPPDFPFFGFIEGLN